MQRSSPFSRSLTMLAAIQSIMASAMPQAMQQISLAGLGEYKSRGHGRGVKGKIYRTNPRRFTPNGPREVARRQRQIAKGMLSPVHPA